jgi:hypothetical protein
MLDSQKRGFKLKVQRSGIMSDGKYGRDYIIVNDRHLPIPYRQVHVHV